MTFYKFSVKIKAPNLAAGAQHAFIKGMLT
jgi:hypothetical protein